jgi:aminodeoxyfutalosine synthase
VTVAPPARATPEPGAPPAAVSPAAPHPASRLDSPPPAPHPDLPDPSPGVRLFPRPEVDLPVPADGTLAEIERKVHAGERLSFEDGLALYAAPDLLWLGGLARAAQRRISGDRVYFNVNRHINLTNVCKARCAFCSFRRDEGEEGAYTMTVEEAVAAARETASALDITELHIVNGLHPGLPFDYYLEALRALKEALPHVHLKAFTAVEVWWFARLTGMPYEEVLRALIDAGLGSLPGGGAEIFAPRVRRRICGYKSTAEDWLEVHRTAHALGLKTNSTMLYGHIETPQERVDHVLRLRDLQDETGGFQVFIPLRYHSEHNRMGTLAGPQGLPMATALESARVFAVSRLLLDNVPHLKAYWIMLGLDTAQTLLEFGVDDIDGTVVQERIYHMAGAATPHELSLEHLLRVIRAARRVPVQRDTVYNVLRVYDQGA